jgi:hypothetical protein
MGPRCSKRAGTGRRGVGGCGEVVGGGGVMGLGLEGGGACGRGLRGGGGASRGVARRVVGVSK